MPKRLWSFRALLLALVGLAFAVRVLATLVGYQHLPLGLDDNNGYHTQSLLLADHGGFYDPFACLDSVNPDGAMGNEDRPYRSVLPRPTPVILTLGSTSIRTTISMT